MKYRNHNFLTVNRSKFISNYPLLTIHRLKFNYFTIYEFKIYFVHISSRSQLILTDHNSPITINVYFSHHLQFTAPIIYVIHKVLHQNSPFPKFAAHNFPHPQFFDHNLVPTFYITHNSLHVELWNLRFHETLSSKFTTPT